MLNEMVVLHELAHCVAPRRTYGNDPLGPTPSYHQTLGHGPGFVGIYAELVREFAEIADHSDLCAALAHFEVPRMTLAEYQQAVAESLVAEADELARFRDWEKHSADPQLDEILKSQPTAFSKSTTHDELTWGELLRIERDHVRAGDGRRASRRDPAMSQERLAGLVSLAQPRTREQISLVERSTTPPSHPRLRRIAMCMAVALEVDPIYCRRRLGLTRAEYGIELEELALINPAWVARVERFNAQCAARPPRWKTDLGR